MKLITSLAKKTGLLLVCILLLGIFFRTYQISSNPPSLNWDEVSIGYNAFSILNTGKDEFGNRFPLYFRSLDDYKMPVYVYATVIAEAVFGLTDFAVRVTSLVAGILLIYFIYILALELFVNRVIALCSAAVLAIFPWNIEFSRMASEANVALLFCVLGIIAFLKGVKGSRWFIILSICSFGLSAYTYLSFRIISPIVGLGLVILYSEIFKRNKRLLMFVLMPAIFLGALLLRDSLSPDVRIRFSGTNFLSHSSELIEINEAEMKQDGKLGINIPRRIIHDSPYISNLRIISRAYLSHFSFEFLLFGDGHKQESSIFSGLMYMWMVPFVLYGLFRLFCQFGSKVYWIVLLLFFVPPIPASLTWDVPHAIRTIGLTIPFSLMTGMGLYYFIQRLFYQKSLYASVSILLLMSVILFGEVYIFYHQYYIHVPVERSHHWQYSRKDMTQYLESVKHKYNKIIISTELEWPYAFMLYYSKYDPVKYLSQGGTKSGGWDSQENTYDKYEFRRIDYDRDSLLPNVLMVGTPDDFSKRNGFIRTFHYLNGLQAIQVFESHNTGL